MKLTVLFVAAMLSGLELRAETGLFEAVRNGNLATVRKLIHAGADANIRNYAAATPLMYAGAFASPELVRLLLDSGADVNATSNAGATALMWATGNTNNVRLLLERGAAVNAKAKDGTTALHSAALRGSVETMKLLMARGADAKTSAEELLRFAYRRSDPDMRQFLEGAGFGFKDTKQQGALPFRSNLQNPGVVRKLLDTGADPNAGVLLVTVKFGILGAASLRGSPETVRTLIEHGADPNRSDTRKRTPLMMAASRTVPDAALLRFLIGRTTDINARDDAGRTALDWALTQGETESTRVLREAGGKALAQPSAAPRAVGQPRDTRAAIGKALDMLLPPSVASYDHWQCVSCHHQSLPAIAAKVAGDRGIPVRGPVGGQQEKAAAPGTGTAEEFRIVGRGLLNVYQMFAFAEAGAPATLATDSMVHQLAESQQADGGWEEFDLRPPLVGGTLHPTALAIRALSAYSPPVMRREVDARITRARDFLIKTPAADTQEETFKLAGLVWSHAPETEISRQRQRLLKLQREDGGWGQLPAMASDAFATGEALSALHWAGLEAGSKAYQKGVNYLLRTQLEDGTWLVRSRAFGFQPYFETGFPHGVDQFISAAATSWAALALAYTL